MEQNEFQTHLPERRHLETPGVSSFSVVKFTLFVSCCVLLIAGFLFHQETLPPTTFTPETLIHVPNGYSLSQIGVLLKDHDVIRSPKLFAFIVSRSERERNIPAGDYLFSVPSSVWEVARRFAHGEHGILVHRVTLPEGVTVSEMGTILERTIPKFNRETFINEALPYEGYLFPDTYFFYSTATSGPIIETLRANFSEKTGALETQALEQKEKWNDVVNLASIVEKEAATPRDRRIIAGILKRRIALGMRLQVDAPFMYTIGKGSLEITQSDLASDSPYNTYQHPGLPPTPIGNPGEDAIRAVLEPETTDYLYYLSDKQGKMYYAKTFAEHKLNKSSYLP